MSALTNPPAKLTHRTKLGARMWRPGVMQRTVAAWIGGGVLWCAAGLLYAENGWRFRTSSAVWLIADMAIVFGFFGVLKLRPHGTSRPARVALTVGFFGRMLFGAAEIQGLVTGVEAVPLLPISATLTAMSTIAYGVVARQADRRLRAASIANGLYFFVVMMPFAASAGAPPPLALSGWGIPLIVVGIALNRAEVPHSTTDG